MAPRNISMTRILLPILISILFLPFCFCTKERYYDPELLAIDTLLQTRPDSAYIRLEQFDTKRLTHKSDSALYALLNAEARYKNYIDDTASSTLKKAEEFFRSEKDSYNLMRTLYYKGLICQNKGSNGEALVAFDEALENADNSHPLYKGKIYSAIGHTGNSMHDNKLEKSAAIEAWTLFKKIDSIPFIQDAQLIVGLCLVRDQKLEGIEMIKEVVKQTEETGDTAINEEAISYLATAYLLYNNYRAAKNTLQYLFDRSGGKRMTPKDKNLLLWAMVEDNAPLDSLSCLAQIIKEESGEENVTYEFYEATGDYKKAFISLRKEHKSHERQYARDASSDANFIRNLAKEERLSTALKDLNTSRQTIIWMIATLVSSLLLVGTVISLIIIRKNNRIKTLIDKMGILNKTLENYTEIKEEDPAEEVSILHSSPTLKEFFIRLDSLYSEYYRCPETQQSGKGVMSAIKKEIDYIRASEDFLHSLENEINCAHNNILKEVYESIRRVNDNQRRLVVLMYFKFSIDSICLILDVKPDVFYNRKTRLKKSIISCKSSRKQELLSILFPQKG